jgi:hypothetical protein
MERDVSDNSCHVQSVSGLGNINANVGNTVVKFKCLLSSFNNNTLYIQSPPVQGPLVENRHI